MHLTLSGTVVTAAQVRRCKNSQCGKEGKDTAASIPRCKNPKRATPATWNEGGCLKVPRLPCLKVPRLPRKVQLHVAKCHACHAKSRGVHGDMWEPSAPPEPAQCHTCHACHVKRRWTKVDVSKCHACHAKCSYMSPSATPATQKTAASTATSGNRARHQSQPNAIRATPATWNEGGCFQVPRLPSKVTIHVTKCPRLPHKVKVDVSKCHACHAKCSYMSPSATPATQKAAASTATCGNRVRHPEPAQCHAKWRSMSPRTSCVMKLFTSCVSKYHACHVKRRWMSSSATPATQSNNPCHEVPRLPRKQPRRSEGRCHKVATPATQSEGGCHKVPRLPHKLCASCVWVYKLCVCE